MVSGNVYTFFIAWDGLGLRSALLVSYYSRVAGRAGGITTLLFNRSGDAILMGSLFFFRLGLLDVSLASHCLVSSFVLILYISLYSKRAQFPFSS